MALPKMIYLGCIVLLLAMVEATPPGIANHPAQASCKIKKYKMCYNLVHVCPKFCPDGCEVECASCKPICLGSSPGGDTGSPPPPVYSPPAVDPVPPTYSPPAVPSSPPPPTPSPPTYSPPAVPSSPPPSSPPPPTPSPPVVPSSPPPPTPSPPTYSPPAVPSSPPPSSPPPPTPSPPTYSPPAVPSSPPPSSPPPPTASPPTYSPPAVPSSPPSPTPSPPIPTPPSSPSPTPPTPSTPSPSPPSYSPPAPVTPSPPTPTPPSSPSPTPPTPSTPSPSPPSYSPPAPVTPSPSTPSTPEATPPTPTPSAPWTPPSSPSPPTPSTPEPTPPTPTPSSPSPVPPTPSTPSPSTPSTPPSSPTPVTPSPATPAQPPSSGVASKKRVRCTKKDYGACYGQVFTCPANCPTTCQVDCNSCKPVCSCDYPGAVCQDPRFIGGDGITFYFHGKKDRDFCLVTDPNLHINAHFIGKTNAKMTRDFTWVQSIGILFDEHRLYLGARKTSTWDDANDRLAISLDGLPVFLPETTDSQWQSTTTPQVTVTRTSDTNNIIVEVQGKVTITTKVVPITEHESRVHNYDITKDDSFAHLDLGFKFKSLSGGVDGVLGKTYRDDYVSKVKMGVSMPVMGGIREYSSSNLFATDCLVSKFGDEEGNSVGNLDFASMNCASGMNGEGVVCKR